MSQQQFADLLARQEPLVPELAMYFSEQGGFPTIRHPLVYSVPYFHSMNALLNEQLAYKKQAVEKAMLGNDWMRYITLHERPWRVEALRIASKHMIGRAYWEAVSFVWSDSENIHQNRWIWRFLLQKNIPGREFMMEDSERAALEAMPSHLAIYRGCACSDRKGLSWTTSKKTARWFASRTANLLGVESCVFEATVEKSKVIAYLTGRNEKEVIVLPSDLQDVRIFR